MPSPTRSPPSPSLNPFVMTENTPPRVEVGSSEETSQLESRDNGVGRPREKKRVGFTGGAETGELGRRVSWLGLEEVDEEPSSSAVVGETSPQDGDQTAGRTSRTGSEDLGRPSTPKSHLPEISPQDTQEIHDAFRQSMPIARPRPAIRRTMSTPPDHTSPPEEGLEDAQDDPQRAFRETRMREAFERGKKLEEDQRSTPNSRHHSPRRDRKNSDEFELDDLAAKDEESSDDSGVEMPALKRRKALEHYEAHNLVRRHTRARRLSSDTPPPAYRSGHVTPTELEPEDYRPHPKEYRGGILGSLLKLYNEQQQHDDNARSHHHHRRRSGWFQSVDHTPNTSRSTTPQHSPPDSGSATPTTGGSGSPKSWFRGKNHYRQGSGSLAQLIGSSASLGSPVVSGLGEQVSKRLKEEKEAASKRSGLGKKSHSSSALAALNRVARGQRLEEEVRITVHIAETIARQRYLMRLCRALMQYGAPTHRLEEYMRMSARVLELEAQFLYIPGSMIMSFDDPATHTTEVKLVRVGQGLDLGKLRDVHETYKDVVHDKIGVEEATARLKEVDKRKEKYSRWVRIPVYGLAAVCVGPFAFQARLIDLPIAFILGCILGILQLVVSPASDLYANVFEIMATVITSFLARAFGSIPHGDGYLFCFSALAQSSIALILPGYIVLCASLELQSKSIVAGSIRMVYAVIYTLFLGYGITIGTAIYGIIDKNATSQTTCPDPIPGYWIFFFVPGFTLCLIIINKAKWKQAPVMLLIAFVGYLVNYFSAKRFLGNTQVSNTLGALAIGVLANAYSRIGSRVENWCLDLWEDRLRPAWKRFRRRAFGAHTSHSKHHSAKSLEDGTGDDESTFHRQTRRVGYSLAAAAMLPAIFVQVPSGLAVNGSLVSGIASANQIAGNATNGTQVLNSTTISGGQEDAGLNSLAFNVSYSVIQVAIGITVGLFLSAIVVYPLGKRRSGLFSL